MKEIFYSGTILIFLLITILSGCGSNNVGGTPTPLTTSTPGSRTPTPVYTATATPTPLSTNADLASLTLSNGILSPAFTSGVTSYTATVPRLVASITVTPIVANTHSTVTVNGIIVPSGSASSPISLTKEGTLIRIIVTAQSGLTKSFEIMATIFSIKKGEIVRDIDGNSYNTIVIGKQTWFVENLRVSRYRDGSYITKATSNSEWESMDYTDHAAYCYYNDNSSYATTYGYLYNWYAVKTGLLAPKGWHVPTNAEWTTLENTLIANGYNYDGTLTGSKIAKSLASTSGWSVSYTPGDIGCDPSANNTTSFSALPGGFRDYWGNYCWAGERGHWWASDSFNSSVYYRYLYFVSSDFIEHRGAIETDGFSVRCVKDN